MEYHFGPYRLLPVTRELRLGDTPVPTTRLLFDLIAYLVEHRDRAVGRDELVGAVWGRVDVADARVSELVMRARRAVGDDGQEQAAIRTITGFGYRWIAATVVAEPTAPIRTPPPPGEARFAEPGAREPTPRTAGSRRRIRVAIGVALALATLAATWIGLRIEPRPAPPGPPGPASPPTLAVLPLSVDGPNEVQWIRLGAMELVANRLREGGLTVAPSENVVMLIHAQTTGADSTPALQQALGAGRVVRGSAARRERQWKIELATESADGTALTVQAERPDAIEAAQQAADMLSAALGRAPPALVSERNDLQSRLQQAQSALLANRLDTARAILDAAPEPDRADPRLRYRLATIDVMGGRLQAAETALDALATSPEVRAQPQFHSRVLTTRGRLHFRARAFAQAERDFDAAIAAVAQDPANTEAAQALTGRGIARVALHRFDDAAADLGRARLAFEAAGDTLGKARVDANFGMLEAERARPEQALPYLLEAAARFEEYGVAEQAASILVGAYDAQAALLHWSDALATADRQWAMRERIGDPGIGLLVAVNRANALASLGRLREADAMLNEAARSYPAARAQDRRFLDAQRADLAWREGHAEQALAAAERALAAWPEDDFDAARATQVLLRQRALIALGGADRVRIESAWPAAGSPHTGVPGFAVARAEWAARQGDAAAAEREFRAGLSGAETMGAPAAIAQAAQAFASWLLATGRIAEARAIAGRISPWAERDFDCAVLQLRVLTAGGAGSGRERALQVASRLAGEREIPFGLGSPDAASADSSTR